MQQRNMQPHLDNMRHYFEALSGHQDKPIRQRLDPRLFSPENETVGQCLAEAQQTLLVLQNVSETVQAEFYAEKLVAQYHALLDLLQPNARRKPHFAPRPAPLKADNHSVHQLPHKERLEKYYDYLRRLNDLIAQQNEALLQADASQQPLLMQKIQHTEQRKQRCQDAIDNLEEYLLFVAERERGESAV